MERAGSSRSFCCSGGGLPSLLGFGMNLKEVVHAGASGFMYTAISIAFALSLGVLLGKLLQVARRSRC